MLRDAVERFALVTEQSAELGLADAHRVFQHGLEYGLQLAGRARYNLKHLRGRGLLLQRFGEIAVRWLHLVETDGCSRWR